jgi:O-antigen ligase
MPNGIRTAVMMLNLEQAKRSTNFQTSAVFIFVLLTALILQNTKLTTSLSYVFIAAAYAMVPVILLRRGTYEIPVKRIYAGLFLFFSAIVFIRVVFDPTLFDLLRLATLLSFTTANLFLISQITDFEVYLHALNRLSAIVVIAGLLPFFGFPSEVGFVDLSFWGTFSTYDLTIITSVFVNPNQLGFFALVGTIAALIERQQTESKKSILFLWMNAIGLFSSHYRAGWIALLASLGLFYTYSAFGRRGIIIATVGGIFSIAIGLSMLFGIIPGPEKLTTVSLNGRRELWTSSVQALQTNPLIGHGLSGTHGVVGNPHNSYLRIFSSFGLIGGFIYTILVLGPTIESSREAVSYNRVALTMLLVSMVIIQIFNQLTFIGVSMRSSIIAIFIGYQFSP